MMMTSSGDGGGCERHTAPDRRRSADNKQVASAICWRFRREIAAALWRAGALTDAGFPRHSVFKRPFEALPAFRRRIPAAFGLTGIATMPIKALTLPKGMFRAASRDHTDSRSDAHRRGWIDPPARRSGARKQGLLSPFFIFSTSMGDDGARSGVSHD
jgi:hypothetical protein